MAPLRAFAVRIFVGYFVVLGVAAYIALGYFSEAIKPAVRQTMEEFLVEESSLLATVIEHGPPREAIVDASFGDVFRDLADRKLDARIYGVDKNTSHQRVYVTDARGIVVFDSSGRDVGADYSRWNDVARTLAGGYGARSTHDAGPNAPSTLYVAAPIRRDGRIVGAVTVAKPVDAMTPFLVLARTRLLRSGSVILAVSLGIGLLFALLIARSITRLRDYATRVAAGQRVPAPAVRGELSELAAAIESMRTSLEGKQYVEKTIQTMAHELRSPLTAVVGAAEILEGPIGDADRARFAGQIGTEARRMQDVIDRLLELAVLERRRALKDPGPVPLEAALARIAESRSAALAQKDLRLAIDGAGVARGEALLVEQALANLVDNAIAFADRGSTIAATVHREGERVVASITNRGPAIPDFAEPRLFERFYSLPRPETQRRSTGLGLSFVRQIAELHGGEARLANVDDGVRASLEWPAFTPSS